MRNIDVIQGSNSLCDFINDTEEELSSKQQISES